ncbi:MAG TPA: HAD-IA family hydrolase [Microthrixaceae bacterium]|jgi:HAD superfamily hydrolase (TIGR01509 family)|nr:HAD-IA family hydrolase [Microthrixaceae bacterium]
MRSADVSPWTAVVFDFDGLILDTETPLYDAWRTTFEHHGAEPIPLDEWLSSLGLHDDDPRRLDPFARLQAAVDRDLDSEEVQAARRVLKDTAIAAELLRPGVTGVLDQADELGLPVAVASSSSFEWVGGHLAGRGLLHRFATISCAENGVPGKPAPDTYLRACAAIGVAPTGALALEDSPNGVRAAKAAGLTCVAVPNPISRTLDYSHSDATLTSLEELDLTLPIARYQPTAPS